MKQISAAKFVEENLKTIFAYSLSKVSNRNDAEDLTNDIVLAILQSADKIKNYDAFYGYVWGIAANTYRKFMKRKGRAFFDELDDNTSDEFDFTEEMCVNDDIQTLHREISLLSKEYRECTVAYYYDELSCAEISKKFSISLEMVKYYLFKTRKILKEGICMEREFGEKSFNPVPFELMTIFYGDFNNEYRNLFSRKLPGQILMSAYYAPMTVKELAIELGVASVYLEDEIAMLEKYNLISKTSAGKYQTNLVIFTDSFTNEFEAKAETIISPAMVKVMSSVKEKLCKIRQLNVICEKIADSRLLWSLIWPLMRQGSGRFQNGYPQLQERDVLYSGATGTNYGISNDKHNAELDCSGFAGYSGIDSNYYASGADFGVLPQNNRYFNLKNVDRDTFKQKIYKTVSGEIQPEIVILTEKEEKQLFEILSEESSIMAEMYNQLFSCACRIMRNHAPKSVASNIDRIVFQTLFFRTVGLIGGYTVKSGAIAVPDFEGPAAVYVRENTKAAENSVNQGVLV